MTFSFKDGVDHIHSAAELCGALWRPESENGLLSDLIYGILFPYLDTPCQLGISVYPQDKIRILFGFYYYYRGLIRITFSDTVARAAGRPFGFRIRVRPTEQRRASVYPKDKIFCKFNFCYHGLIRIALSACM